MSKGLYISLLSAYCYGVPYLNNWNIADVQPLEYVYNRNITTDDRAREENETNGNVNVNIKPNDDDIIKLHWWNDSDVELKDIWKFFKCQKLFDDGRPVHNESTWLLLRGAYSAVVDPKESSIGVDNIFHSGFQPGSVEVKLTKKKGRGLFAKNTIEKADLVWKDIHTACFRNGKDFKKYLASIPSDLTCDILEWAYSGQKYGICVDLDEASIINHASLTKNDAFSNFSIDKRPNLDFDKKTGYTYATQDISVGDELLVDYLSFEDENEWENLGLGVWKG